MWMEGGRPLLSIQHPSSQHLPPPPGTESGPDADPRQRRADARSAGPRQTSTDRAPGPDTKSAGPRHKERRGPTQRAPGPTQSAGPRHKKGAPGPTLSAGPRHKERRAPTQRAGPGRKSAGRGPPGRHRPRQKAPGPDTDRPLFGDRCSSIIFPVRKLYYQRRKIQPALGDGRSSTKVVHYQRRKIQPAAGDGRSSTKVVLPEKENPAGCRRPPFQL